MPERRKQQIGGAAAPGSLHRGMPGDRRCPSAWTDDSAHAPNGGDCPRNPLSVASGRTRTGAFSSSTGNATMCGSVDRSASVGATGDTQSAQYPIDTFEIARRLGDGQTTTPAADRAAPCVDPEWTGPKGMTCPRPLRPTGAKGHPRTSVRSASRPSAVGAATGRYVYTRIGVWPYA